MRQQGFFFERWNLQSLAHFLTSPLKWVFILVIRCYQYSISPWLGTNCRFYPSCSQYAIQCFYKYPLFTAIYKVSGRLLRCHPWHPGGVDLP